MRLTNSQNEHTSTLGRGQSASFKGSLEWKTRAWSVYKYCSVPRCGCIWPSFPVSAAFNRLWPHKRSLSNPCYIQVIFHLYEGALWRKLLLCKIQTKIDWLLKQIEVLKSIIHFGWQISNNTPFYNKAYILW
jgi:hypothetical protein